VLRLNPPQSCPASQPPPPPIRPILCFQTRAHAPLFPLCRRARFTRRACKCSAAAWRRRCL
jgi:hypothetical protein